MIPLNFGASAKACVDDWLSFSTWYRWLHLKSNNHLYLGWHQSEGANNPVNIGDECSQHWAAVLARKKSMHAKYFQLVSIEPKGGKVCCPQLEGSNNHSGLRLAIRSDGGFFILFYFFELLLGGSVDALVLMSQIVVLLWNFIVFTSVEKHPSCLSALLICHLFVQHATLLQHLVQVHIVF